MIHAIYGFWVFFVQGFAWWWWLVHLSLIQNVCSANLHIAPWTLDEFATSFANSNVGISYMNLGCLPARIPMVRFSWCVVPLMTSRCGHLNQELSNLLPATISASVHLKLLFLQSFQILFHVFFNSSSPSQPRHIVICVWLVSNICCTYPCVKFTDTTSSPESSFYFHVN